MAEGAGTGPFIEGDGDLDVWAQSGEVLHFFGCHAFTEVVDLAVG